MEKLIQYFQSHYQSRQEVLFRLPLSYSIDAFWPELLKRRKAKATVLPLYNAAGMPYWYVLTDRMIAASERLCAEAMARDDTFDPYRAEMTSAMTEEMFFTSFVEGAQIPLQEAMDFLARGTEPESIQEQMIWNNRRAWSELANGIYRPLDEEFIRRLAMTLTEGMDGYAEDYRQTDTHPIAAMNDEAYDVPAAWSIPDRMNEYYAFLNEKNVHPLIKSAVAQAYLLVTRPFPEGNERLSRMISSAVLLRCGYDFFRDISLSSVIARESYRYYKAMCDIIRPENGGDLTYFVEYYLELLVRAITVHEDRKRRRQQETIEEERLMARVPLRPEHDEPQDKGYVHTAIDTEASPAPSPTVTKAPAVEASVVDTTKNEPESSLSEKLKRMSECANDSNRKAAEAIARMVDQGVLLFNRVEFLKMTGLNSDELQYTCKYMLSHGIVRFVRKVKVNGERWQLRYI